MSQECGTNEEDKRGTWNRKIEYFLSILGLTVGLGNLWRFPYICLRNGGGAFLIPYVLCLLLFGMPLFFLETAVAQFSAKTMYNVWEVCPIFKGVGVGVAILNVICEIYYNTIITWIIYFMANSFVSPLPWTRCDNSWNTQQCTTERRLTTKTFTGNKSDLITGLNITNQDKLNGTTYLYDNNTALTSQEEFWLFNVLQISPGIEEIGRINWKLLLCLLGAWTLVGMCIVKGVKSIGKVVYVTALLPYVLLTIVLVRGLTLDGGIDGIKQYLWPNFETLTRPQVWMEAAVQMFYSLGVTFGPLYTMASFNKFKNNCLRDSLILSFTAEGTSVYAGLIIYSILGFMSTKLSIPMEDIVTSGPGLVFMVYQEALAQIPGSNVWAVIFFVMLLSVGLDSQFAFCETLVVGALDNFPKLRQYRTTCVIAVCFLQFLFGIIFVTQGGMYIFQIVDWYIAVFCPVIFGLIECFVFGWIYGMKRFSRDVKLMLGRDIPVLYKICICFITPTLLLLFLIYSIIGYQPPTYGTYVFPSAAVGFGVFISVLPLLPLPVCGILVVWNSPGDSLKDKLGSAVRPTKNWKPRDKDLQTGYYNECDRVEGANFMERVKMIIFR